MTVTPPLARNEPLSFESNTDASWTERPAAGASYMRDVAFRAGRRAGRGCRIVSWLRGRLARADRLEPVASRPRFTDAKRSREDEAEEAEQQEHPQHRTVPGWIARSGAARIIQCAG